MDWILHQMNINNVLLNRVIEEEMYVEKPQGFEVYHKETLVCRWKNTLYGFKTTWCIAYHAKQKRGEKFL
jgi:hypothetical protein